MDWNRDDPALRPLVEAGEGESEGFEEAERELIEHASHGDQHGTARLARHGQASYDRWCRAVYGEADDAHLSDQ